MINDRRSDNVSTWPFSDTFSSFLQHHTRLDIIFHQDTAPHRRIVVHFVQIRRLHSNPRKHRRHRRHDQRYHIFYHTESIMRMGVDGLQQPYLMRTLICCCCSCAGECWRRGLILEANDAANRVYFILMCRRYLGQSCRYALQRKFVKILMVVQTL